MRRAAEALFIRDILQPVEPTKVALFAQFAVERGDRLPVDAPVLMSKLEMRRPQQRDHRCPREARLDELEDEIERRGKWLRRERQRVRGLIRQACAPEDFAS